MGLSFFEKINGSKRNRTMAILNYLFSKKINKIKKKTIAIKNF